MKKRIPFNLTFWTECESLANNDRYVETFSGDAVNIIKTDAGVRYPIIATVGEYERELSFDRNGLPQNGKFGDKLMIVTKAKFGVGDVIRYRGDIYEIMNVDRIGNYDVCCIGDSGEDTVTGIGHISEPSMVPLQDNCMDNKEICWEPIDEDVDFVPKKLTGWIMTSDTLYHNGYKIRLRDLETLIKKK
jgi:hypothetical protein